MPTISDPRLFVEKIEGHPGRRRLVLRYGLEMGSGDPVLGEQLIEQVVVRARDLHDAPQRVADLDVRFTEELTVTEAGSVERVVAEDVQRALLDVEQDWWRTDHGGGIDPIAEFEDHLVADLSLVVGGNVVAVATTPTITGSWGALGDD